MSTGASVGNTVHVIQNLHTLVLYFELFYMGIASSDVLTHVRLKKYFQKKMRDDHSLVPIRSVAGAFLFSSSSLPVVGPFIADATNTRLSHSPARPEGKVVSPLRENFLPVPLLAIGACSVADQSIAKHW